jgi:hypothetical protein
LRRPTARLIPLAVAVWACAPIAEPQPPAAENQDHHCDSPKSSGVGYSEKLGALSSFDCSVSTATGYQSGTPFTIKVATVDGKKVEVATANAYYVMAKAAAANGVQMKVVSGFRTMAEQTYLYNCYKNCNCNNCNLAAKPGYSNHQSGHALDLNTSAPGVYNWLVNHGGKYGFKKTVPSEDWHWEWWGGGPGGGICNQPPPCPASCSDGNPCTDDTCDKATGKCVHTNNGAACDDGDGCTTGDNCKGGKCVAGAPKDCNDKNPCTDDGCLAGGEPVKQPAGTCTHANNKAACNDGNACTTGDQCGGGICKPGAAKNCDDGNTCTNDACVGGICSHAPNAAACSDGNPCSVGDHCEGGACKTAPMNCDDGLPCTVDKCAGGQCQHEGAVQPVQKLCVPGGIGQSLPCGGTQLLQPCPGGTGCENAACVPLVVVQPDANDSAPGDAAADIEPPPPDVAVDLAHPPADASAASDDTAEPDTEGDTPSSGRDDGTGRKDTTVPRDAGPVQAETGAGGSWQVPASGPASTPASGCTTGRVDGPVWSWWALALGLATCLRAARRPRSRS